MLTDRQFPDPLPPATNPHSDLAHPMPPAGRTHDDRPHVFALSVTDTARRYVKLLDADAADEFLAILGDMLPRLNPAPAPEKYDAGHYVVWGGGCSVGGCTDPLHRIPTPPASDDDADVFPGIFAGVKAGDFGGLPLAPFDGTVVLAPVPKRLCDIAGRVAMIRLRILVGDTSATPTPAVEMLDIISDLHAVADAIASEGGDQ